MDCQWCFGLDRYPRDSHPGNVKIRHPYFRFMESLCNSASLKKFEFLRQFSKALRKLDHVLLWILSTNTGLWQCSTGLWQCSTRLWQTAECRVKKILMTSNVLPLHFSPSQASSSQNSQPFAVLWSWFLET